MFICHFDTDTSISFMILILSDTFDIVYSPIHHIYAGICNFESRRVKCSKLVFALCLIHYKNEQENSWWCAVKNKVSIPAVWLPLGLCIIYFMRCDTYHDIHEAIFDMYQQCILSGFRQKPWYIHKFHGNLWILMTQITWI